MASPTDTNSSAAPRLVAENSEISFSAAALEQISKLSQLERDKLAEGLSEVYGKLLSFMVKVAYQSYVHRDEVELLSQLRSGRMTVSVYDYGFRITICKETAHWHVNSIAMPGYLDGFKVIRLSSLH